MKYFTLRYLITEYLIELKILRQFLWNRNANLQRWINWDAVPVLIFHFTWLSSYHLSVISYYWVIYFMLKGRPDSNCHHHIFFVWASCWINWLFRQNQRRLIFLCAHLILEVKDLFSIKTLLLLWVTIHSIPSWFNRVKRILLVFVSLYAFWMWNTFYISF